MTPQGQLELSPRGELVEDLDVVDGAVVAGEAVDGTETTIAAVAMDVDLAPRKLVGEADRIATPASTAGTRRQYAAIYGRSPAGCATGSAARRLSGISTPT
jgi:hypothetical protein